MNEYKNRQTFVEGKGNIYYAKRNTSYKCPRHPDVFKFPGKKKCNGCPLARYEE